MAVANPAMVREVAKEGHTIGSHTWSHAKLSALPADKAEAEVELGLSAVAAALEGPVAPFFRFPYLRPNATAVDYLKSRDIAELHHRRRFARLPAPATPRRCRGTS
ncbi:MAG: polysaccharide deacetylase family protein [Hyphomicrobium sp.]